MKKFPWLQQLPPTEPVDQGDEGEWDTVGEATGSVESSRVVLDVVVMLD
jgi:hypothetical protein